VNRRFGDIAGVAIVAVVMIAYVAPYAWATLPGDTVRDLLQARAIARGDDLPTVGPPINSSVQLGPVWWYLAALPMLFTSGTVGAMLFTGALGAAKFPLAYVCGTRLESRRFGLCFAMALALPSVAVYQWVLPMHPGLVEAALLLALACVLRYATGERLRWLCAAALALGFAVQLHPTAVFYVPLLAAWLLFRRRGRLGERLARTVIAMLLTSVWFWPTLASDFRATAREQWTARGADGAAHATLDSVTSVARALFIELPYAIGGSHLATSGRPTVAALALLLTLAAALLAGLTVIAFRGRRELRVRVLLAAALFVAGLSIVSTMRSYVSFYTVYFLLPLIAFVAAASLDSLLASRAALLRVLGAAGLAAALCSHVVASWRAIEHGRDAFLHSALPALGDLRNAEPTAMRVSLYPVGTRSAVGRALCRWGPDVTLHGDLAYRDAGSFSLDTLLACDRSIRPTLGGREPASPDAHHVGFSRGVLRALGRSPQEWLGRFGVMPPVALAHPALGPRAGTTFSYFEQAPDRGAVQRITLTLEVPSDATVVVYNYKPFDSRLTVVRMSADNAVLLPVLQTVEGAFYRAQDGARAAVRWTAEIETDVPQWVDVFAF
jgi:hypothetical protein